MSINNPQRGFLNIGSGVPNQNEMLVQSVWPRTPASIITGFLGAGKPSSQQCLLSSMTFGLPGGSVAMLCQSRTTLLNHILKNNHGKKIAIIENEFGEVH